MTKTVDSLSQELQYLELRLTELKIEEKALEGRVNVLETKLALLVQKCDNIEIKINSINATFTWFSRAFLGVIIAALAGFIVAGGLSL